MHAAAIVSVILGAVSCVGAVYVDSLALFGIRARKRLLARSSADLSLGETCADGGARGSAHREAPWPCGAAVGPAPEPVPVCFLVLVPAHNEEAGIAATVTSILNCRFAALRLVVVADNCSDATAAAARLAGAEVWERHCPERRGKGPALAWAVERAAPFAFDLLAVVDADACVSPIFFAELATAYRKAAANGQVEVAFQARNEFPAERATSGPREWFNYLSVASKAAENTFAYLPRSSLGLVNLLQGNGIAISRAALRKAPMRVNSVTEDAEYAVALALAQVPVLFVERALVVSRLAAGVADAAPQRLRWASGIWQLILQAGPRLIRAAVRYRDWRLAEAYLSMVMSSRLILAYLTVGAGVILLWARHDASFDTAMLLVIASVLLQGAYLALVLRKSGAAPMPFRWALFVPAYAAVVGIAQAGAVLGVRRHHWHRTVR